MTDWLYLTNFYKRALLHRSRDLHTILKMFVELLDFIPYSRHQNNDYIAYGSRDMADWPYLTNFVNWPWLPRSPNLQAILKMFVIFLFLSTPMVTNIITITSRYGWLTQSAQLCQMTLTTKVTWSSHKICNIFVRFLVLWNCIAEHQNDDYIVYGSRDMADYSTNFVKWPWLPRSRDLQTISKICLLDSLFFKTL